jgi:hypothetical protein
VAAVTEVVVHLIEPHPAQAAILVAARRFNVLQCGRRFGKTQMGVLLAVEAALAGQPVGWFAPTYKFLDDVWRDLQRALRDVPMTVDKQQRRLDLCTGGTIECWTMDTVDPARGRKYALVILDEASVMRDLEAVWTEAVRPTLTDLRGAAWFLGTPKGRNAFHRLFVKGQTGEPEWASWRFATVDNPYMDADEVESARRDLPDLAFRQEYLGEAIENAGNPFGIEAIRACIAPLSTEPVISIGQDLAKSVDWNVTVGLDANGSTALYDRWQGPGETTETRVLGHVAKARALIDSTGVGDPIVERLQKGRSNIDGFKFTALSKQQLMEGLAGAIHRREITYPDGPIVHELEAFQYEYTASGVHYAAPAGMHDDCVCALALAVRLHAQPIRRAVWPSAPTPAVVPIRRRGLAA